MTLKTIYEYSWVKVVTPNYENAVDNNTGFSKFSADLNKEGSQGWELVTIIDTDSKGYEKIAIFKRSRLAPV